MGIPLEDYQYYIQAKIDRLNQDKLTVVNEAKTEAYEEFAERLKGCILERDNETINCIKENLIKELKRK